MVKSPKVYVRDSGILHALLNIATIDDLSAHPIVGRSWEGFVIEQIMGAAPPLAEFSFYRTTAGAEMDLVVTEGSRSVGYEIKLANAPTVGKGFWHACEDLGVERAYVVAPVSESYPLAENVEVISPLMLGSVAAGQV